MALQVRRGTNTERLGITPLAGELVYTTDTKQLYVGDGSTAGGITSISGTIDSVLADTTPQLGGTLDLNGNDITGTGNINITGTITATGNINLGDGIGSDIVVFGGAIQGHLVPDTDITWNLGSPTKQFNEAWISQLNVENQLTVGRINGNLIADDSTVVFDATAGTLLASTLTGSATINVTGDLTGSVFGDDSTLLIDGVNNKIVGAVTTPNLKIEADGTDIKLLTISSNVVGTTGANDIVFESYGGSTLSRTNVVAGNAVVDIIAKGWHTDAGKGVATIRFRTDPLGTFSNPSTGLPGSILFATFDNAGTQPLLNYMELDCQGRLNVGGTSVTNPSLPGKVRVVGGVTSTSFMRPGVYADDTARDAEITSPAAGMMVFNTTGTKFQGYTGSAWVDLN